jgi:sporulation protein YlmC with PRC-barrel domain
MPHYGALREVNLEGVEDLRGSEVYGVNNEKLGTIDDVIFDHSTGDIRYIVVDAGSWLSGRKFIVPAERVAPYGNRDDKYYAELDKERIQMLPEYDEKHLGSEDSWSEYESRYKKGWNEGTVLYNKETGRIVTPPSDQVQGTRTQPLSEEGRRSLQRDFTPEKVGKEDDLWGVAPSGDDVTLRPRKSSIAGREDARMAQEERTLRQKAREEQGALRDLSGKAPLGSSRVPDVEGLREPEMYDEKMNEVAAEEDELRAERVSDRYEPPTGGYGPRWIRFQKSLREGRDKVVSECRLCGSQKKVA